MIEHVAFLGSKKRGKLLRTGARSNAYTDFHHTVFHIHSPTSMQDSDEDLLPFVLDALNEIAFYPNFLTSRIEKERRAILSELQMMNSIEYRVDCLLLQHLHSENKLSKRFPIGLEEQIKKWDAEKIWKFNERWYFPANATLLFGQLCPELQHVELTGLHRITDDGFTQLIECCEAGLVKVNISGCINLTDKIVCEMSKVHGGTLEVLNLNGCRSVTDASMVAIASNCLLLNELDVSECGITDIGISALACAVQLNLNVLSLSACRLVSDKSLPFLLKIGASLVGLNIQHCHGISNSSVGLLVDRLWNCDILS